MNSNIIVSLEKAGLKSKKKYLRDRERLFKYALQIIKY